ncbi:MAG: bifunctional adenosylcobinamide kinase/adenosylcobinamide-phosphate guanylyltransferase [Vulcanimicrobiaceae bacterium]
MTTIVLGPVRSGKSARAAALAQATGKAVIVAATAAIDLSDSEMRERVARHRRDRPADWTVVETAGAEGPSLTTLLREADGGSCILVDALGTWIAALLFEWRKWAEEDAVATLDALEARGAELVAALHETRATVIVVAEETGWGVVPVSPIGRLFRDAMGRLVQRIAADAEHVELVVAGYAVDLRAIGERVGISA